MAAERRERDDKLVALQKTKAAGWTEKTLPAPQPAIAKWIKKSKTMGKIMIIKKFGALCYAFK